MPQTQEVRASLGCGTLILIAIIVFIFSGNRNYDRLEKKIDNLTEEVEELRSDLEAQRALPAEQEQQR